MFRHMALYWRIHQVLVFLWIEKQNINFLYANIVQISIVLKFDRIITMMYKLGEKQTCKIKEKNYVIVRWIT